MTGIQALDELIASVVSYVTGPGSATLIWLIALIFAIAGATKLLRPAVAAGALVDFGLARRIVPSRGKAMGLGELMLGTVLAVTQSMVALAIAAVALSFFSVLIGTALIRGRSFPCFCLGDSESMLSVWTLLRTASLALLSSMVMLAGDGRSEGLLNEESFIHAISAASLVSIAFLGGRIPRLLRWNRLDPLGDPS